VQVGVHGNQRLYRVDTERQAEVQEVYRWLVRPELLVRWIGVDAQLEPRSGGRFRIEITDGQWCSGRYLELNIGSQVERMAGSLGRRVEDVNEITELTVR